MIDPGKLKTRMQIQAPVESDDGQGGVTRSFATLTTAWAEVTPFSARGGGADVQADAEGATVKYRILLRSNFILTLQHRLVDGGNRDESLLSSGGALHLDRDVDRPARTGDGRRGQRDA